LSIRQSPGSLINILLFTGGSDYTHDADAYSTNKADKGLMEACRNKMYPFGLTPERYLLHRHTIRQNDGIKV